MNVFNYKKVNLLKKIVPIALIALSLVACSNKEEEPITPPVNEEVIEQEEQVEPPVEPVTEQTEHEDHDDHDVDNASNGNGVSAKPNEGSEKDLNKPVEKEVTPNLTINTKSGIFYGIADSNSIEVDFDGEPNILLVTDEVLQTINDLNEETKVEFNYFVDENGQKVINEIKEIK